MDGPHGRSWKAYQQVRPLRKNDGSGRKLANAAAPVSHKFSNMEQPLDSAPPSAMMAESYSTT
jgi:hypothetical protein